MKPRPCRGCRVTLVVGRGIRYCEPCQAQRCLECSRRGGLHSPTCSRGRIRRCRACQAPVFDNVNEHRLDGHENVTDGRSLRYCAACRQRPRCYHCQRIAGHTPTCPVGVGRGRQVLPSVGLVCADELVTTYASTYAKAVRIARSVCGPDAEDAVQRAATYLYARLDTLTHFEEDLFMLAVWRQALKALRARRRMNLPAELGDPERRRGRAQVAEARA